MAYRYYLSALSSTFVHPRYLTYLILHIVELLLYLRLAILQPSDGVVGIIDGFLQRRQPTDIHAHLIDLLI